MHTHWLKTITSVLGMLKPDWGFSRGALRDAGVLSKRWWSDWITFWIPVVQLHQSYLFEMILLLWGASAIIGLLHWCESSGGTWGQYCHCYSRITGMLVPDGFLGDGIQAGEKREQFLRAFGSLLWIRLTKQMLLCSVHSHFLCEGYTCFS